MTEYCHELKIPKERIAVLIGKNGEIKKEFEESMGIRIEVNSTEGEVAVRGDDPVALFSMREVVKAIGRGFNPEVAKDLLKQDYCFELINLADYVKTKNHAIRLKGRVIGTAGKSRKAIEELCDVSISVYGKTIGIIGLAENVATARKAVESLLSGSPHSSVYKWLEKQRKNAKFQL